MTTTSSKCEIRTAFSDALGYYRRVIPGTDTARKAAAAIVRALDAYPWLNDQIPFSVAAMARREAQGLPPVAR